MHNVLMVVSSYARMPNDVATGLWLEELAASYYVFADAGCHVEIASPRGGAAPVDPLSLDEPWLTASGRRYQSDVAATRKLSGTLPLDRVDPQRLDALYLVGGAATAWDFPQDAHLAALVSTLFGAGRLVAGVCHGVLGLTGARDRAGELVVARRNVTGISNVEETLTGFDKLVPLLPETTLTQLGGRYSCAPPLQAHVVVDDNLLTGQNPASAGPLALAVLDRLQR